MANHTCCTIPRDRPDELSIHIWFGVVGNGSWIMFSDWGELPSLPEIGLPETFYAKQVAHADKMGNHHAARIIQGGPIRYVSAAPRLRWEQKRRYFRHAIKAHCVGPAMAPNPVLKFYARLGAFVRGHAGAEAIRLASREDDAWAAQLTRGVPRDQIRADAAKFFRDLLGEHDTIPEYLNREDWDQLRILRRQWL